MTADRNYATLSRFRSATPRILSGNLLKDVRDMQVSITQNGLVTPLLVSPNQSRLIVIDGRKRLLALRRLQFDDIMPPTLTKIPYNVIEPVRQKITERVTLNPVKIYRHIRDMRNSGRSISEMSRLLALPKDNIRRFLAIDKLSPRLQENFFNHLMTMDQVLAFATLPNVDAQDALFSRLGVLASEKDILDAIRRGQTVLTVSNDNVIILPSRYGSETG